MKDLFLILKVKQIGPFRETGNAIHILDINNVFKFLLPKFGTREKTSDYRRLNTFIW